MSKSLVRAALLSAVTILFAGACVERTVTPADPLAGMRGTWKGTRHLLVFDDRGVVVPDSTAQSSLTIIVGTGAVTFIDSEGGTLHATVNSQDASSMSFTLTDGNSTWVEDCQRRDHSLAGTERFAGTGAPAGVWAAYLQ